MYVSAVSFAEIRFGAETRPDDRRAELLDGLSRHLRPAFKDRVLEVTEDILSRSRLLLEEGRNRGHTYSPLDLLIGATALHHGLTVVTRNTSDYERANVPALNPWLTP